MSIRCQTCGHPERDHFDGVCWHDSPEDTCCEVPDLGTPQCRCERYRPPAPPPAVPDPAAAARPAVCGTPRPADRRYRPRALRCAGGPAVPHRRAVR